MKKPKKKDNKATYVAVGVGILIVSVVIFYYYSADQARNRGEYFGNSLKSIQDDLKQTQTEFYSKKKMLEEESITKEEFLEYTDTHIQNIQDVLKRYNDLVPPQSFAPSLKLFVLSTQKQLESDQLLIEWIRTNDTSNKVRSDLLLQESFENEIAALDSFNKAKNRSN
ncbi:hypothetical protein [Candidatus Nitrosotenuis sp. DW1]|uniref:hypothetical protein n=1 Tax=Candidatus Nitrosotenuis sp. DW1 TaxID=2259672 RepID=UPI0015CAE1CA|nr:hypothetical protein [Candidatus Nitrosotenuis sp. DW1]QLH09198.1 hypothetical protein DSQ19_06715 [Candidatus Nitrosotenuis sp. DW1]